MKTFCSRCLLALMTASIALTAPLSTANAALIATPQLISAQARAADAAKVDAWFAQDQVRAQLEALGVDAQAAQARVAALTDAELQQLALHMDEQPAGGLLGTLGVIFVVLLVLEFLGVTDIFKRI